MALVRQNASPDEIRRFTLAQDIIKASRINVFTEEKYGDKIVPYLVRYLKESKRNPAELIKVASHSCMIEIAQLTLEEMYKRTKELEQDENVDQSMIDAKQQSTFQTLAKTLADGFDVVEDSKFIKDASRKPIGITEAEIGRYPECHKALERGETFLGGKRKKRRQTKKRNLKKHKKTLRRIRH